MESVLISLSAITLAAGGLLAYAVRGRSSKIFGTSIWRGDRSQKMIALTFDDGPSESTPDLLALLRRHQVSATFFMCGKNVERLPHIARAVAEAGHEIGNHSDTHPRFDFCSSEFIYREIAAAQEKIAAATGLTPTLFRAPFGVRWFGLRAAQKRLNLLGVMWTTIGHDWNWPSHQIAQLLAKCEGGAIVCLHDGRIRQENPDIRETVAALQLAIPAWKQRGLGFATISSLLGLPEAKDGERRSPTA